MKNSRNTTGGHIREWGLGALSALVLLAGFPGTSEATIIYQVNRTITDTVGSNPDGSLGSVVGSITTDGTIGALVSGNITAWSLTLDDGVVAGTTNITQANSVFALDGPNLVASATQLTFDFNVFGDALFNSPLVGSITYWGLEGALGTLIGAGDGYETVRQGGTGWTSVDHSGYGTMVVAEVSSTSAPEPTTLTLLGLGLVGLGFTRRKMKA